MARTTLQEVQELLGLATPVGLQFYVLTASNVVDTHLTGAGLADNTLRLIETALAAHLYDRAQNQVKRHKADALEVEFKDYGLKLETSRFGQSAAMLDTTGKLKGLGMKTPVFRVLS